MQFDYVPRPIDTSNVTLSRELQELTEKIAENVHNVWAARRIKEGWAYGSVRNDINKTTPCLVPYDQLPDEEKMYDRQTAMETLKLIVKLGFEISRAKTR